MEKFFQTILLTFLFCVGFFLLMPSYTFAAITRPQCCYVIDYADAPYCSVKSSSNCEVIQSSCGAGGDGCDQDIQTNMVYCDQQLTCTTKAFSDTGVFWEYKEKQSVKYGLPAKLVLKVTPKDGSSISDVSCVNCSPAYTSVSVQSVENGGTQMTITFDTKKAYDAGLSLPVFSVVAEVVTNGVTTHSLRRPVLEITGVADQLSLCKTFTPAECAQAKNVCFAFNNACYSVKDQSVCSSLPQNYCGTTLGSPACTWSTKKNICQDALTTQFSKEYTEPDGYDGPLPACAFDGSCRDINDLLRVAIKIGELALGFVGSLALVFFVYGGFTMILSMGNAEKVKKGRDILVASVIGIVIAFSAYAIVNFTLDVLQVQSDEFRVIK
jgi:hypothetical protein